MTIWLISDTHFGHANMLRFTGLDGKRVRPYWETAAEMDEAMVDRWNSVVKPGDHVYHLGDVAMRQQDVAIVRRLVGRKRLVLGNHDIYDVRTYQQAGFQKIFGSRKLDNLLLTHYPIHPTSIPHWALGNVHGHTHEKPTVSPRHFNVSVEQINYTPVSLEDIKVRLASQQEAP